MFEASGVHQASTMQTFVMHGVRQAGMPPMWGHTDSNGNICKIQLKASIREKWVCSTEINMVRRRCPVSFCYAISLNANWAGPTGKHTIWQFQRSPQTCLGPQAMVACLLNLLYSHSAKRHMERNCGSHHWNASLCAADSLMTTKSLTLPKLPTRLCYQ